MKKMFPSVINLNVGGKLFSTRHSTLLKFPDSMLGAMFSGRHHLDQDANGSYFIDRDSTYFGYILNFLRNGDLPPHSVARDVLYDALYYGIQPLVDKLRFFPSLFGEFVVRDGIRKKLEGYFGVLDSLIGLAQQQILETSDIVSKVKLVTTKNQPIPRDLQFSKQIHKQYYKKFKTYQSFESCFGRFCIHLPSCQLSTHPDPVMMDQIVNCLFYDLKQRGFSIVCKVESIKEEYKIKTITWCYEEFHICVTCHIFEFHWLNSD